VRPGEVGAGDRSRHRWRSLHGRHRVHRPSIVAWRPAAVAGVGASALAVTRAV
jgi:hypothetical protein